MNQTIANPYVGPRPYRRNEGHLFFGREREARDLLSLVLSERLVLFYAMSGAGKSSLINARLVPKLEEEGFEVLPVARVYGLPPDAEAENIFVANLMLILDEGTDDPARFSGLQLAEFLAHLEDKGKGFFYQPEPDKVSASTETASIPDSTSVSAYPVVPRALIIDQFEELFTAYPQAWEKREDFFRQLNEAMQADPSLWVVLAMREEYVAGLDPFAYLLPNGLRARYYMQRMGYAAALDAVKKPAEGIRPFAENVAEKLVDNLRLIATPEDKAGGRQYVMGEFIEPVQLQVVCYQLWENLQDKPGEDITEADLMALARGQELAQFVNGALADYYEAVLGRVLQQSKSQVTERALRDWFSKKLITEAKTRGLVYQGEQATEGIPNTVVHLLESQFLVRGESRAGGKWYELVHDRFIDPILRANQAWLETHLSALYLDAEVWESSRRDPNKLYDGKRLQAAQAEAKAHPENFTELEQQFLQASSEARRRRGDRRRTLITWGITLIFAILCCGAWSAYSGATNLQEAAEHQAATAQAANTLAVAAASQAMAQGATAEADRRLALTAEANALTQKEEAKKQTNLARVGELSALALSQLDRRLDLALLLGVEDYQLADTYQSRSTLFSAWSKDPRLLYFLPRYTSRALSLAISPDGKILASGSEDNSIHLWDITNREPLGKPLTGHTGSVESVAFSPDGKSLASGSDDYTIRLWDVASQQPLGEPLSGHTNSVWSVAFSPDGKSLASSSLDSTIRLWDVASHQPLGEPLSSDKSVKSVAFSPDGKTLASGSVDGTIRLWDFARHQPLGEPIRGDNDFVESVAFSPDGKTLASGGGDSDIHLWDVASHQPLGEPLSGHNDAVWDVTFSPDGKILASGSADYTIRLWDVANRQPLGDPLTGHTYYVRAVAFSPDGQTLASAGYDNTIRMWDVNDIQPLGAPLEGSTGGVYFLALSPDGQTLASGGEDYSIHLWDMTNRQPISGTLNGHTNYVNSVAFSPDGKTLASGSSDTTIRLWDVASQQPLGEPLSGHTDIVWSVAFSPDGKTLASGSDDNTINLWDVASQQPLGAPLTGHKDGVRSVVFSPDGKILASGSDDNTINLWDVANQQLLGTLYGHTWTVASLAFSPDGKTLVSGSYDNTLRLWDVATLQSLGEPLITANIDRTLSVAFSPDGKILASGSQYGAIRMWDVATNQSLGGPLTGHTAGVSSLAFTPDGKILVSGSYDGTIRLWEVDPQLWVKRNCERAGRNMSQSEWIQFFPDEPYHKTCPQWPDGE